MTVAYPCFLMLFTFFLYNMVYDFSCHKLQYSCRTNCHLLVFHVGWMAMYVTGQVSCWSVALTQLNMPDDGALWSCWEPTCQCTPLPSRQTKARAKRFKCKWARCILTTLKRREPCRSSSRERTSDHGYDTRWRVSRDVNLNSVRCVVPPEHRPD